MKRLVILFPIMFAAGCVTGYNPTYFFNEVQVVNLTGGTIEEVSVSVVNSPKTLSCDQVAKNALCDDRFGKRRYPQQGIELSWLHGDGSRRSEQTNPAVPVTFSPSFPLRVMLEIDEKGTVKAFFEQEEPGRDGGSFFFGAVL